MLVKGSYDLLIIRGLTVTVLSQKLSKPKQIQLLSKHFGLMANWLVIALYRHHSPPLEDKFSKLSGIYTIRTGSRQTFVAVIAGNSKQDKYIHQIPWTFPAITSVFKRYTDILNIDFFALLSTSKNFIPNTPLTRSTMTTNTINNLSTPT